MQKDLFDQKTFRAEGIPLAEILRPKNLSEYVGQDDLVGKEGVIRKLVESDQITSMIFWGPPGVGKTTLARIIANETKSKFIQLSAVTSGKKDLQYTIKQAKEFEQLDGRKTILFIDEIHRFNKAQQDYLLPFVEDGTLVLIGATTENPSFEVISALLSRTRVFTLNRHSQESLEIILDNAIKFFKDNKNSEIFLEENARELLIRFSNGDPRVLLNAFEIVFKLENPRNNKDEKIIISKDILKKVFQTSAILYDRKGEEHYNIASALIKSMRASDADAAIYWLARMLVGGEDPKFIARRCMILASEDVGNADPMAVVLANSVFDAIHKVGMPEARILLSQLVIYLAKAPKDNSAYVAIDKAMMDAQETMNLEVPMNLRNAPTKLMKNLGYGKGYIYDHSVEGKKSGQQCLPDELVDRKYL